jgi:hypothetical protein
MVISGFSWRVVFAYMPPLKIGCQYTIGIAFVSFFGVWSSKSASEKGQLMNTTTRTVTFPNELYDRIKAEAALNYRPVSGEILALIEEGLKVRNEARDKAAA